MAGNEYWVNAWTDERIEQAKEAFAAGKSAKETGDEIGKTRNSVISKWHRLGLCGGERRLITGQRPKNRPAQPEFLVANILERRKRNQEANGPRKRGPKPIPAEPDSGSRCSLMELTADTCRWPIGDITERDGFSFCGAHTSEPPYCEFHQARAYNRGGSQ